MPFYSYPQLLQLLQLYDSNSEPFSIHLGSPTRFTDFIISWCDSNEPYLLPYVKRLPFVKLLPYNENTLLQLVLLHIFSCPESCSFLPVRAFGKGLGIFLPRTSRKYIKKPKGQIPMEPGSKCKARNSMLLA